MIHEVLLALAGYQGSIFERSGGPEFNTFLHPGEKVVLERILKIASYYKNLKDFVEQNVCQIESHCGDYDGERSNNNSETNATPCTKLQKGSYLQAFCNTLNEILDPYRKDIAALEEEALKNVHLSLSRVIYIADKHSRVLMYLNKLITQMQENNVHGCQMLGFLYRNSRSGAPKVDNAVRRLRHGVHVVFFKQLSNWILYGQLLDSHQEFLIQRAAESHHSLSLSTLKGEVGTTSESASEMKLQGNETKFVLPGSDINIGIQGNEQTIYQDSCEYVIDFDVLPPYIAASVASKILFIGQTVLMFGNSSSNGSEQTILITRSKPSMWAGKEKEFFIKLQKLQQAEDFNEILFQKTIDEIHSCVTEHLWQLVVEEGKLFLQLKLMKDFFLLGRGELFLEFIKQAGPALAKSPCSNSKRDVNQALQIAARKVQLNDEAALEKFYFNIPEQDKNKDDCQVGWQLLSLKYKVSWPLHLLFTPDVLENYNHLFQFLLRVTKVQYKLNKLWSNQITDKSSAQTNRGSAVWQLRNNLVFLINNLQYYLQADVLESQYMQLETTVLATKDFQKVQQAHTVFLTNVLSQTFILIGRDKPDPLKLYPVPSDKTASFKSNPVHRSLISFLSLCEEFCSKVSSWEFPLGVDEESELHRMNKEFMTQMQFLLQLLSSLRSEQCGSHLSQLLLRLDYNRWFSNSFSRNMSSSMASV